MNYEQIDEAMLPFFEYVQKLSAFDNGTITDQSNSMTMRIESVGIEMPFELDIQSDGDGNLVIGASPPLYYVQTTVEPVFHSMKIRLVEDVKQQSNYGS